MNRDNRDIDTERVIAEVKLRSCLWDSNHPKRKEIRAAAWDEVLVAILGNITDEYEKDSMLKIIQQRWKTARDAFFRTKSYTKNGDSGKKLKKYIYYDDLCFLSPNDANFVFEETGTNQDAKESSETQNTKVRKFSVDVLKPGSHKRRNKRCQPKPKTNNDSILDFQVGNHPLSDSQFENECQKENKFDKELLMLLSSQASTISSDDLFFFLSMGSVLNTFDTRQKLEFRSKVLAAAADVQSMYNRPNSSASQSSVPETAESPEDVKPKVEILEFPE